MTASPRTEHEFTLPFGYLDARGRLHSQGVMRLATALDEIEPLSDPRVVHNEAYLGVLLLSRVVRRLGSISPVTPDVVGALYAADFAYLQELYTRMNSAQAPSGSDPRGASAPGPWSGVLDTTCPQCGTDLQLDLSEASAREPA